MSNKGKVLFKIWLELLIWLSTLINKPSSSSSPLFNALNSHQRTFICAIDRCFIDWIKYTLLIPIWEIILSQQNLDKCIALELKITLNRK